MPSNWRARSRGSRHVCPPPPSGSWGGVDGHPGSAAPGAIVDIDGTLVDSGRLGPVLWQLPGTFARDDSRLAAALAELPREYRHCIEFRHPSWFAPDVMQMLREHDVALVIGDHPDRPFQMTAPTATWSYIRFHYGHRGRRGNYSARELSHWARRIRTWSRSGQVYAYFNNDWEAFAVRNAQQLAKMCS